MYFFYYYPVGVDVPRPRVPVASWSVSALLFAIHLAVEFWGESSGNAWLRYVYRPAEGSYVTPLSACFLHAGWLHLAGNLLYLLVFAPALETAVGGRGIWLLFCGTGYLANLIQGLVTVHFAPENAWAGVVGASGAVSGMLGFFIVRYFFARLKIAYWAFLPLQGINRTGAVYLPAFFGVVLWLLLQVVHALVQGKGGGTAYGAHLGGLAAGLGLAFLTGQLGRGRLDRLRSQAAREREAGNLHGAVALLDRYLEQRRWDENAWLELARTLSAARLWGRAQAVYGEIARKRAEEEDLIGLTEIYLEARRGNQSFCLRPSQMRNIAFWLEKNTRFAEAVAVYLDLTRLYPEHDAREHSMVRAASLTLTRLRDRRQGLALVEEAIADFPDGAWRHLLERERNRWQRRPEGYGVINS